MDCDEFERLVEQFFRCELTPGELREFECHASDCEDCRGYLTSYSLVVALLKAERRVV